MPEATTRPPGPPPASAAVTRDQKGQKEKDPHPRDPVREVLETIVFVVVLVLLLKLFVTEAFVIPTGSMAETLYGYQKVVECPECGLKFPVNSHDEVEPNQEGEKSVLVGYTCPNCRFPGGFTNPDQPGAGGPDAIPSPPNRTGDRVLVLKPMYHVGPPRRGDVVVFKYPEKPQDNHTAQNYIKRAMAFGGETVGVHRGELYVTRSVAYPDGEADETGEVRFPRPSDPKDLWKPQYMYPNAPKALELFEASRKAGFRPDRNGFTIARKTDDQVLACRRVVWDNDHQPKSRRGKDRPRWSSPDAGGNWAADRADEPKVFTHSGPALGWLRYRHLVPDWSPAGQPAVPSFVTNFLGYNAGREYNPRRGVTVSRTTPADAHWVGDLVLECEAEVGPDAEVVLELSRGVSRFQARFAGGRVTLVRTESEPTEVASADARMAGPGKYKLRFANVDSKLRVWVDERPADFGGAAEYAPAESDQYDPNDKYQEGWTTRNDVAAPASVGAKGDVTVRAVKLFRDIYYTSSAADFHREAARPETFYVQPDHYMCLGDNSAQSSDSRKWGLVPERLMLGKAVFVFWPVFPDNRVGFIK